MQYESCKKGPLSFCHLHGFINALMPSSNSMSVMEKEIVIIVGGSKGIGEAIVKRVAAHDRVVIFTYYRSKHRAEGISRYLTQLKYENYYYKLDVSKSDEVTDFIEELGGRFHRLDVLVNNAGVIKDNPLYLIDDKDWYTVIDTNLSGVFFICRAVSKYMIRQRSGKIVNISSIVARTGSRGQANYCASKGGIEALTRALAVELAKKNVTVNCVSPGVIETRMTRRIIDEYETMLTSKILLNRIGKPEEVAGVVRFLISEDASYINGQVIHVDGGML